METCFSQPIIFIIILKIYLGLVLLRKTEIFVLFCYNCQLHSVNGGKFVVKEKKNNPKLAVNIMQEIEKEIIHQEYFISTLSSCFDRLANSVIFAAEFCGFVFKYKRDSLTNFRAQKARENLRREKGAEENRRVFEKTEGRLG